MAATIQIHELTATMAGTDKTSGTVRFKLANDQTVDANNPITIPSTGGILKRSYTKQIRLYCSAAPDTQVDNLRAYADGSNTFGASIDVYASPINPQTAFTANATTWTESTDLFSYTSVAPCDMDAYDTAAITDTGYGGDILKLQMRVGATASSGTLSAETLTFAYDEI